jgi:hypothetical protein
MTVRSTKTRTAALSVSVRSQPLPWFGNRRKERVGPEGRKLFEKFIRQVNVLQAKQQLEARQFVACVRRRSGGR